MKKYFEFNTTPSLLPFLSGDFFFSIFTPCPAFLFEFHLQLIGDIYYYYYKCACYWLNATIEIIGGNFSIKKLKKRRREMNFQMEKPKPTKAIFSVNKEVVASCHLSFLEFFPLPRPFFLNYVQSIGVILPDKK